MERIRGFFFSLPILVAALTVTASLCKSANGWFALFVGFCSYTIFKRLRSNLPFVLLLLVIPMYIGLRATDSVSIDIIKSFAVNFVDEDRAESLVIRLTQENLFSKNAWERPVLGWGGYDRGWPTDPATGEKLVRMIDSTWLIAFSTYGLVGLVSLFFAMLQGPWKTLRLTRHFSSDSQKMVPILLSFIVVLFMIDALFNGMVNPVYIMASGAVMSWYLMAREEQQPQAPESSLC